MLINFKAFGEVADIKISDLAATSLNVGKTSIFDSSTFSIVESDLPSIEVMNSISSESINSARFLETFPNPMNPIIIKSLIF